MTRPAVTIEPFSTSRSPSPRTVAGVMSGTSLDGVDVVIARLTGSGRSIEIETVSAFHEPFREDLIEVILRNTRPETSSVDELTRLNVRLGHIYADAVRQASEMSGTVDRIDLIGSHGQTIYHAPDPVSFCGEAVGGTLQLGDISTIANRTDIPVVGDFRAADVALGGEGAPLVPYFDYVRFTDPTRSRLLLNIGGIANLTFLPAGGTKHRVRAFDTGPGNMLIDGIMRELYDEAFDRDGRRARRGSVCDDLLTMLFARDAYQDELPPKSTGREHYGSDFLDTLMTSADEVGCLGDDVVATATAFTAQSVHRAYKRFIAADEQADELIVAGGGANNPVLMDHFRAVFDDMDVRTTAAYELDPDDKEALCFAVLAHEYVNGVPTNLPAVTGASHETLLGKLALPPSVGSSHDRSS